MADIIAVYDMENGAVREFQEEAAGIAMVFVKGGEFSMGHTKEQGNDCYDDEKTVHSVTVSDFYAGKYPVTQKQWLAVMGSCRSIFRGDDLPVENVSWNDVREFARKLSSMTGKGYRLLTEAEWEYAARGGAESGGHRYAGSDDIDEVAWCRDNCGEGTRPVGAKKPNELGLYDMSGNVWEWVGDWYGEYSKRAQVDPQGPKQGSDRVFRGGCWCDTARFCRVSFRFNAAPDFRFYNTGFRIAMTP